ncbi:hypothetical protein [Metabacillus sediminilitoris]|uniref:Uncharacterized protein n=1 Tax=Metabacillus sediminilitoris TaxID=2567941 RepID=A0A4S4BKD9_9BACI|nr:hypothetical protein [Metabacillus sediminilitoris]QGQ45827.1 hypothetical protein GMB29_11640 [Metabacillus sediminilitoris]THF75188.1 hypothetical protein E6W99_24160 [Metabacillus sediminilitoris]
MKRKLVLTIGFVCALALSIGLAKDLQSPKVFAQTEQSKVKDEPTANNNGDQYRVISVEEQNMVENSSAQQGFVPQESGTGFFFTKVK